MMDDGLAEGPEMPKGACALGGVAKTGRDGGGGWDPTVPKETEVVDLGREGLAALGCDNAGDQPTAPSKRTPGYLARMTLCMCRSDRLGCSVADRSACGDAGASLARMRCCQTVKTGCNMYGRPWYTNGCEIDLRDVKFVVRENTGSNVSLPSPSC
jgi:hypothetical protein